MRRKVVVRRLGVPNQQVTLFSRGQLDDERVDGEAVREEREGNRWGAQVDWLERLQDDGISCCEQAGRVRRCYSPWWCCGTELRMWQEESPETTTSPLEQRRRPRMARCHKAASDQDQENTV